MIGWKPDTKLVDGITITYKWISEQVEKHGDSE